jgi:hypothetical protein
MWHTCRLGGLEIASVDLSTDDVLGLAPLHTTLVLPCHLHLGGDFALGLRLWRSFWSSYSYELLLFKLTDLSFLESSLSTIHNPNKILQPWIHSFWNHTLIYTTTIKSLYYHNVPPSSSPNHYHYPRNQAYSHDPSKGSQRPYQDGQDQDYNHPPGSCNDYPTCSTHTPHYQASLGCLLPPTASSQAQSDHGR